MLLAALAFAISGCTTTVGRGQTALRDGRYALSPQSRDFIATSLESAVEADLELQDTRSRYAPWPYQGYSDPFFWGWRYPDPDVMRGVPSRGLHEILRQ